jgi:MoaA/NifB/PqqE/SkfB family radical SAM enzyme
MTLVVLPASRLATHRPSELARQAIDGPEWANVQRHDRSGRAAYGRIMRGIAALRSHGIDFSAIAVVTPATVHRANELAEFFEDLGCTHVGFNIEEQEGANDTRPGVSANEARAFWGALLRRRANGSLLLSRRASRKPLLRAHELHGHRNSVTARAGHVRRDAAPRPHRR